MLVLILQAKRRTLRNLTAYLKGPKAPARVNSERIRIGQTFDRSDSNGVISFLEPDVFIKLFWQDCLEIMLASSVSGRRKMVINNG